MSQTTPNITVTRRNNLLALLQGYVALEIASGEPPKGIERRFGDGLQIKPSMLSQIKKDRPIGDKLARQIEALQGLENGWLDIEHGSRAPSEAEEAFVALCREAWRNRNAKGKRELRRLISEIPV